MSFKILVPVLLALALVLPQTVHAQGPVLVPSPPPGEDPVPSPDVPDVPSPDVSPDPPSPDISPDPPASPSPEPSPSPSPSPEPSPSPVPVPSPPPADPRADALLQFKSAISNSGQISQFKNWQSGSDPCFWGGIVCTPDGTITDVNLASTSPPMAGTISSALASVPLQTLTGIDLSGNKLSGSIPDAFAAENALPNLLNLNLARNSLSGGPSNLGEQSLKQLKQLSFDNNQLRAFLPWQFAAMELLTLNNNLLNTNLPEFLATIVPAGKGVVILPQQGTNVVCGALPTGPVWAEMNAENQPQQINSLPSCTPQPPPAASPPPAQSPPAAPPVPTASVSPPPPVIVPPPPPSSGKSGLSTTTIIAIGVGSGVGLILLIGLLFWCCRKPKKGAAGDKHDPDLHGMEEGYYTADGEWKSLGNKGNNAAAAAAAAAAGLPTIATHRRRGSSGSGALGTLAETPSKRDSLIDPLFDWTQRADVDSALAAAALGTLGSPKHAKSSSRQYPLDMKLWNLNFKDLTIDKQIGEGSFGRVYLAKWNETPVAVKVLLGVDNLGDEDAAENVMSLSNPVLEGLAKESTMMASLRHPNVVGFLGICMAPPCMITEYCARGSLTDVLRGGKANPAKSNLLDWARRLNMALDAAKGMLYLHAHSPPIIHRDLKSPNLLVDKHWRVKVSDFNLSKLMDDQSVMSSMAATNPRWLAPEILTGNNATFASDVYSFAIVLWEMLTWELPWGPTNPWQVVTMVTEGGRLEVPSRHNLPGPDTADFEGLDAYVALMRNCWAHIPDDRPTFQQIISELRDLLSKTLTRAGRVPIAYPVNVESATPTKAAAAGTQSLSAAAGSTGGATSSLAATPTVGPVSDAGANNGASTSAAGQEIEQSLTPSAGDLSPTEPATLSDMEGMGSMETGMSSPGSGYASTTAQTGSLMNPEDLNSGWASKLGSKLGMNNK